MSAAGSLTGEAIRLGRVEVLGRADLSGRTLARQLCDQMDGWFTALSSGLPDGWALAATGGYALGQLAPGSDIDIVLLHPDKGVTDERASDVANSIWYPLWDAGLKLSPAVHSPRTIAQLAARDLVTITSLLGARPVGGDEHLVDAVRSTARQMWRKHPWMWLERLLAANTERWFRHGDVSSLLEPDLKEGHGGLRDYDAVRWALLTDRDEVARALEGPIEDLAIAAATLAVVRGELHRHIGRSSNVLLLQDQDIVAGPAGYDDADEMMLDVSAAAHVIAWTTERFWERVAEETRRATSGRRRSTRQQAIDIGPGARLVGGEVQLTSEADLNEQSTVFRIAAIAAHGGHRLARGALLQMANVSARPGERWSDRTRQAFLSLLGSGEALVGVADSLEFYGLLSRFVPEWQVVRSRPQRNAFHIYTVDRHLLQAVVEANAMVRSVARPDLLLVGAFLHDIGKGHPGDHTEVGTRLAVDIARRMGFPPDDVDTLRCLVDCHLLLPETATRRDLDDPRTAEIVAERVGNPDRLELLRALTEADSRATGPTAWNDWKEGLVDALVHTTAAVLRGLPVVVSTTAPVEQFNGLVDRAVREALPCIERTAGEDFDAVLVASSDQRGLFANIAGTFALHGVEVVSADAWTTPEGVAIDRFQVRWTSMPNWSRVERDLRAAVSGQLDVGAVLEQRVRPSLRTRRAQAAAAPQLEVLVSNADSATTTMLDVRAPDAVAVLYRLAAALRDLGLDIRSAKVATLGHEVVDVFYVDRLHEDDHPAVRQALTSALVVAR